MKKTLSTFFSRIIFIVSLFFSFAASDVYSQHIQLTHKKSERKLKPIIEGMRVRYLLKPLDAEVIPVAKTGVLTKITSNSLTIDSKTINIDDLQGFGRKKKGSNFFGWLLTSVGNTIWINTLVSAGQSDIPQCTNCTVYVQEDASSKVAPYVWTGVGMGVAYLGIRTFVRNSKKNVESKWKLEVVNATK